MIDIKLNNQQEVASSNVFSFLDPNQHTPPKGVDLHLLTRYGCAVRSKWSESGFFIGWQALPSISKEMKYSM